MGVWRTASADLFHAIPGDHVEELRVVCDLLDVDYDGFGLAGYGGAA